MIDNTQRSNRTGADKGDDVTRARVLDSAAALFAENGIDRVTTRAISERAGANVAAVNYYFGGKDNLSVEVFRHVARESAERRFAGLDRILENARIAGGPPPIRDIIEVFVDAYVSADAPRNGTLLAQLVLKHRLSPTHWTQAVVQEELDPLAKRFISVLCLAAPYLEVREVHWRYHMMAGAVILTMSDRGAGGRIERLSEGQSSVDDTETLRAELVNFATTAFGPTAD
ncbi:TetR family transcriptional regulator [Microbaculum marinisediminis]|uniref:TetR family transcriptional regulator n=1 Tax=Microbaculum marinisediminis TaxID=2931392 RepID=A0AAW5R3K3_9HYPH|nr:TetR family transcriptional regulator [Microbaculum sp. A6E488]MCT8973975.1 TetR family transcriptional regulator [Microbaculum sp. A6E488]